MTDLGSQGKVTFRIIENEDQAFLYNLYKSTRAEEMAHALMTEGDKEHFLEGQFRMQSESHALNYIGAVHRIIQLNGQDVGRMIVLRTDDLLRLIDLSLMPWARGRGLGSDILRTLINEAHGGKVPMRLAALRESPAIRLYLRHGFVAKESRGHHVEMEWSPT